MTIWREKKNRGYTISGAETVGLMRFMQSSLLVSCFDISSRAQVTFATSRLPDDKLERRPE